MYNITTLARFCEMEIGDWGSEIRNAKTCGVTRLGQFATDDLFETCAEKIGQDGIDQNAQPAEGVIDDRR